MKSDFDFNYRFSSLDKCIHFNLKEETYTKQEVLEFVSGMCSTINMLIKDKYLTS